MSLVHLNFYSKYLKGNTDVNLILPDLDPAEDPEVFYSARKQYPVLWLLHGGAGDYSDWVRKTNIELYAVEKNLIVVMPSALNSEYCNWPKFSAGYYFHDYFIHELMPLVYAWFPASSKREDNYLAGLSMGGMGTWKFAVNYPEKFSACAVLSAPSFDYAERYQKELASGGGYRVNLIEMNGGLDVFLQSKDNARRRLADQYVEQDGVKLPRFFVSLGSDDFFLEEVKDTVEYFRTYGADIQFQIVPGYGHEWRFWDLAIQDAIIYFEV